MRYREQAPCPALRPYVRCIWTLEGTGCGEVETVVPDGCPELIVHLGDPFARVCAEGPPRRQSAALVAGQMRNRLLLQAGPVARVIGAKLHPAALPDFTGLAASEFRDAIAPLNDVWKTDVVSRSVSISDFESLLLEHLRPRTGRTRAAVDLIEKSAGRIRIGELAGMLGCSRRTVETDFLRDAGLTPKEFSRIVRFQRLLQRLGRPSAAAAVDAGFYDQSHLIREFHSLAGCTPREYRKSLLTSHFSNTAGPEQR